MSSVLFSMMTGVSWFTAETLESGRDSFFLFSMMTGGSWFTAETLERVIIGVQSHDERVIIVVQRSRGEGDNRGKEVTQRG